MFLGGKPGVVNPGDRGWGMVGDTEGDEDDEGHLDAFLVLLLGGLRCTLGRPERSWAKSPVKRWLRM